jgi:hypothetical protein
MTNEPLRCARCRQPLPAGISYCLTCGHTQEQSLQQRRFLVPNPTNHWFSLARTIRRVLRVIRFIFGQ